MGVRYYNGMATAGEVVVCRREPSNPVSQTYVLALALSPEADPLSVRFQCDPGGQCSGTPDWTHPKNGSREARRVHCGSRNRNGTAHPDTHVLQDPGDITIEAVLTGEKGFYECPIRIYIYGTADALGRENLEERLKKDRLVNATQLKQTRKENDQRRRAMGLKSGRGTAGLAAGEPEISLEQLAQTSQAVNFRVGGDIVQTLAMDEDQLSRMPEADQPDTLRATLLPYQLQGLAWLTAKESPAFPKPGASNSIQLWKRDARGRYINTATNFTVASAPGLLSGGILADDMGLGKTLQIISLIMTGGQGSTLIVAPVGVMSNWEQQIRRHVSEEHVPKVLIYHGNSRQTAAKSLNDYGVVITSYGTLSSEANGGALSKGQWRRVVLDEGHTIRNAKTKAAEAACKLNAQSRWVLTGTPM